MLLAASALIVLLFIGVGLTWAWLWHVATWLPDGATLTASHTLVLSPATPILNLTKADLDTLPVVGANVLRMAVENGAAHADLNETQVQEWKAAISTLGARQGIPNPSYVRIDDVVLAVGLQSP